MVDKILDKFKDKIRSKEVKKGSVDIVENVQREVGEKIEKIVNDLKAALEVIPEDYEGREEIENCINSAIVKVQRQASDFQDILKRMVRTVQERALNGQAESAVEKGGGDLIKHYKGAVNKLNKYSGIKVSEKDGGKNIAEELPGKDVEAEVDIDTDIEEPVISNKERKKNESLKEEIGEIVENINKTVTSLRRGRSWTKKGKGGKETKHSKSLKDIEEIEEKVGDILSLVEEVDDNKKLSDLKWKLNKYYDLISDKNDIRTTTVHVIKKTEKLHGYVVSADLDKYKQEARKIENDSTVVKMTKEEDGEDGIDLDGVKQVKLKIETLNSKMDALTVEKDIFDYTRDEIKDESDKKAAKERLDEISQKIEDDPKQCIDDYKELLKDLKIKTEEQESVIKEEVTEDEPEGKAAAILRRNREKKAKKKKGEEIEKEVVSDDAKDVLEANEEAEKLYIEQGMIEGENINEIKVNPENLVRVKKVKIHANSSEIHKGKYFEGEIGGGANIIECDDVVGVGGQFVVLGNMRSSLIKEIKKCEIDDQSFYMITTSTSVYRVDFLDYGVEKEEQKSVDEEEMQMEELEGVDEDTGLDNEETLSEDIEESSEDVTDEELDKGDEKTGENNENQKDTTESFSEKEIEEMIIGTNGIGDLKEVVRKIIKDNGKMKIGKGEWSTSDDIDKIDSIYNNDSKGKTLRRTLEACLLLSKIDEIIENEKDDSDVESGKDEDEETGENQESLEVKYREINELIEKVHDAKLRKEMKISNNRAKEESNTELFNNLSNTIGKIVLKQYTDPVDKLLDNIWDEENRDKKKDEFKSIKEEGNIEKINSFQDEVRRIVMFDNYKNGEDLIKVRRDKNQKKMEEDEKSVEELLDELGVNISVDDLNKMSKFECEFEKNQIKVDGEIRSEIEKEIGKYSIFTDGSDEERVEVLNNLCVGLEQNMNDALEFEVQREFSKVKHHKGMIATGVGVAAVTAMTSIVVRAGSVGMVGTATGAVKGSLVGGVMGLAGAGIRKGWQSLISPVIEKIKKKDKAKLEEIRKEKQKEIASKKNVKLLITQSLRSEMAAKITKKETFVSEKDYKNRIEEFISENNLYGEIDKESKEKIVMALAMFAKISDSNSRKLHDFLNEEADSSTWKDVARSAGVGSIVGGATGAARAMAESETMAAVVGGAAGGAVGGYMIGGKIIEWRKGEKIKNVIEKADSIISSMESKKGSEDDLVEIRAYLESGILGDDIMLRERAKSVLLDNMTKIGGMTSEQDDFEKKIVNEVSVSRSKKMMIRAGSAVAGMITGGLVAGGINYGISSYKDEYGVNMDTASEKYGVSVESLKAVDGIDGYTGLDNVGGNDLSSLEEVAKVQLVELGFEDGNVINKPISEEQYTKLKTLKEGGLVSSESLYRVASDGVVSDEEFAELLKEVKDNKESANIEGKRMLKGIKLDTQTEKLNGLKVDSLLSPEQVEIINRYQKVLKGNDVALHKLVNNETPGLSPSEIKTLNSKLNADCEKEFRVELDIKNVDKGEVYSLDYIVEKQSGKLGLGSNILSKPVDGAVMDGLEGIDKGVIEILAEDGELNNDDLKIIESIPKGVSGKADMIEGYVRTVNFEFKQNGTLPTNFHTIEAGGSISESLEKSVNAYVKVINTDGEIISKFDANLVHEGDIVFEDGDDVYVIKASDVKVKDGDSLQDIYDNIDSKLDDADVPGEIRDRFNTNKDEGGFHERMTTKEAGEAKAFWDSLGEHQEEWNGLSDERKQEIISKGKWVESWTAVENGETKNITQVYIGSENGHEYSVELSIKDVDGDGVPDEVVATHNGVLVDRYERFGDEETGEIFSSRAAEDLQCFANEKGIELQKVIEDCNNISEKDIKNSGISQFKDNFSRKIKFWDNNKGHFNSEQINSNKDPKKFFEIIDNNVEISGKQEVADKRMKFVLIGDLSDQDVANRVAAINLADKSDGFLEYRDALKYGDQLAGCDAPDQMRSMVELMERGKGFNENNIRSVFGANSSGKLVHNVENGIYTLKDAVFGAGDSSKKVDILISFSKDGGIAKVGYDGSWLNNIGTRSTGPFSLEPITELSGKSVNDLNVKLMKKAS
jgi:hypothetical protein